MNDVSADARGVPEELYSSAVLGIAVNGNKQSEESICCYEAQVKDGSGKLQVLVTRSCA